METFKRLWRIIIQPRAVSRELLREKQITSSLAVVLGFAFILSILFLISYLKADYPPPPEDLELWIDAWGEFSMLPFVDIPPEKYRLAQAVFMMPLALVIWILMAGSARLISILFGGDVTFDQYLNLFGFSFFAFWILGSILDAFYSGIFGGFVLRALRLEYGALVKAAITFFPPVMWTVVLGLGGIYNAIVTRESEQFSLGKSALTGIVTFIWPMIFISLLIR